MSPIRSVQQSRNPHPSPRLLATIGLLALTVAFTVRAQYQSDGNREAKAESIDGAVIDDAIDDDYDDRFEEAFTEPTTTTELPDYETGEEPNEPDPEGLALFTPVLRSDFFSRWLVANLHWLFTPEYEFERVHPALASYVDDSCGAPMGPYSYRLIYRHVPQMEFSLVTYDERTLYVYLTKVRGRNDNLFVTLIDMPPIRVVEEYGLLGRRRVRRMGGVGKLDKRIVTRLARRRRGDHWLEQISTVTMLKYMTVFYTATFLYLFWRSSQMFADPVVIPLEFE